MAYTAPTASDLKSRFPAFVNVADATIDIALGDAALMVDDEWLSQTDFTLGRLLYAAHTLTLDGHGTGAEAQAAATGTLSYQTIRSGQLTLQKEGVRPDAKGSGGGQRPLNQTIYGRRFLELLARNRSGAVLAKSS